MAGVIAQETPDDQTVYAPGGYTRIARSWIDGFSTQIGADVKYNPVPAAVRWADRQWGNEDSPTLSVEDANAKYGIPNVVSFDEPVPEATAAERYNRARDDARRASIIDRSGLGMMGRLSAGAIAGALDPVNIGLSVAPELLLGRVGLGVGAASSIAERAAFYGASGAAGGAWLAPINAYLASSDARQYTTGDILADITLGGAFGAAFPLIGGGIARAFRGKHVPAVEPNTPLATAYASPEAQLETLSTVVRQQLLGLPTDVSQITHMRDLAEGAQSYEFAKWFSGSRAVDNTGRPKRVFHGTADAFDEFSADHLGDATGARSAKHGFFFTDDPNVASSYAVGYSPYQDVPWVRFVNRVTGGLYEKANEAALRKLGVSSPIKSGQNVRPAYLNIKNPKVLDFNGEHVSDFTEARFGDLIEQAKKDGHDGVIVHNARDEGFTETPGADAPSTLYVAFRPDQIRTSIGNDAGTVTNLPGVETPAMFGATQEVAANADYRHFRYTNAKDYRPGETSPYPVNSLSSLAPSRVPTYAANDLAALEQQVASTPSARPEPGAVIGESTPDTREIDAINAEQDEMIRVLKNAGQLDEADLKMLEGNEGEQQYFKDVAKARAAAVECLITNAAEAVDGE